MNGPTSLSDCKTVNSSEPNVSEAGGVDDNQSLKVSTSVFIGEGALLVACAEEWLKRGYAIQAICSADPTVASWASERQLRRVCICANLADSVRQLDLDFLFSIANETILSDDILCLPALQGH